jgi:hypothetical protein
MLTAHCCRQHPRISNNLTVDYAILAECRTQEISSSTGHRGGESQERERERESERKHRVGPILEPLEVTVVALITFTCFATLGLWLPGNDGLDVMFEVGHFHPVNSKLG